jgi:hypothetical protein
LFFFGISPRTKLISASKRNFQQNVINQIIEAEIPAKYDNPNHNLPL